MGWKDSGYKSMTLFSGNSPGVVGTTVPAGTAPGAGLIVGVSQFTVAVVDAVLQGQTGGTLDVYIQSSLNAGQDGSGNWFDVVHYTQLAAAGAAVRWLLTISRGYNRIVGAPSAANPADGTPTLAVNTMIADCLGNALRVVFVGGAGSSAGTTQIIRLGLSQ